MKKGIDKEARTKDGGLCKYSLANGGHGGSDLWMKVKEYLSMIGVKSKYDLFFTITKLKLCDSYFRYFNAFIAMSEGKRGSKICPKCKGVHKNNAIPEFCDIDNCGQHLGKSKIT